MTEADLAVNDLLHDMLMGARPTYGWLSEETQDDATRLTKDRCLSLIPSTEHAVSWRVKKRGRIPLPLSKMDR